MKWNKIFAHFVTFTLYYFIRTFPFRWKFCSFFSPQLIASDLHRRLRFAPQQSTIHGYENYEFVFFFLFFSSMFHFDLDIYIFFCVGAKPLAVLKSMLLDFFSLVKLPNELVHCGFGVVAKMKFLWKVSPKNLNFG